MKQSVVFLFSIISVLIISSSSLAQNFASKENSSEFIYQEGIKLLRAERYNEAAQKFEQTIKLQPGNAEAHNALGATYVNLNRREEALASLREAIRRAPDFASAYYNLGNLFERDGHPQLAAEQFAFVEHQK